MAHLIAAAWNRAVRPKLRRGKVDRETGGGAWDLGPERAPGGRSPVRVPAKSKR